MTESTRRSARSGARAAASLAAALLLLPAAALAAGDTYQLDNTAGGTVGGFVFGGTNTAPDDASITAVEDGSSVNPSNGMLERPYYFSTAQSRYFSLTFAPPSDIIPLSVAVGIGNSGSLWHRNTHVAAAQIDNGRGAGDVNSQFSGAFTGSGTFAVTSSTIADGLATHDRGPGVLTATGTVTLDSKDLEITHVYTLAAGTNFVKVDTTVKNLAGATVPNINLWVGTSDDWIGGGDYGDDPGADSPTKYKGLVSGAGATSSFRSVCSGATNAVIAYSTDEYVLMYGANAQAILSDTINEFDSSLNNAGYSTPLVDIAPDDSEYVIEVNDGSYALYLGFGDVAAGATSAAQTWYFEGGALGFSPQDCNATPVAASRLALVCTPDPVVAGGLVTCEVTGGDPGIDILWEADLDGVFASTGVTLDESGNGRFTFTAPPGSTGRSISVRLVDWGVETAVGVAGEVLPTRLPAGGGPQGPAPALLVGGLVLLVAALMGRIRRVVPSA